MGYREGYGHLQCSDQSKIMVLVFLKMLPGGETDGETEAGMGRRLVIHRQRGKIPQWDLEPSRKEEWVKPYGVEVAFGDYYHPINSALPYSSQQLGLAVCSPAGGGPQHCWR